MKRTPTTNPQIEGDIRVIRKMTRAKKRRRYDANAAIVVPIYQRATQGGSSDYLVINQKSDPVRVAEIMAQAEARRIRRGAKVRVFRPTKRTIIEVPAEAPQHYQKLKSGQVVGHPQLMREVKSEARQRRLQRRAAFRALT